jgi:DNA-binding NarL/FixJ family response regulator
MSHTVLIADDSPFIRDALCNVFEREEDFDVCGQAENGREGRSRQCGESSKVQVLARSIACVRTASISGACGGNDARSART